MYNSTRTALLLDIPPYLLDLELGFGVKFLDHLIMAVLVLETTKQSHEIVHAAIRVLPCDGPQPLVDAPTAFLENCVSPFHHIVVVPFLSGRLLALLLFYRKPHSFGLLFDRLLL